MDLGGIRYSILDPTGNITALVETPVDVAEQPAVATEVMRRHAEVEQVGFVTLDGASVSLCMAGGEFCGNASMCAAALACVRLGCAEGSHELSVRVSGAQDSVTVRLEGGGDNAFAASVLMPSGQEIDVVELACGLRAGRVPVVRMTGITHVIVTPDSAFWDLQMGCGEATSAVRAWCSELDADCLGLMFLDGEGDTRRLVPLVYVPKAGTTFWESSCASGSSAVGMWLAHEAGAPIKVDLVQPGGTLGVSSDPATDETWLSGHVRLL